MSAGNYDSPWKEALALFLRPFFELCFPDAARQIDWSRGIEFLDKELQKLAPEAAQGRQFVDKLVKVWLLNGAERIVFLHLEVQHFWDEGFCKRMFNYFIRLSLMFDHNVASFAILADENPAWHPSDFKTDLLGCSCQFAFPTSKLTDLFKDREKLAQSNSPAALIVLADRIAQLTSHDPAERYRQRKKLTLSLYDKGLSVEETDALLHFYDWLLTLPAALDQEFYEEIKLIEEQKYMPHIMQFEQRAIERGIEKGIEQGQLRGLRNNIQTILKVRFRNLDADLAMRIQHETDMEQLNEGLKLAAACPDLETFKLKF